MVPPQKWLKTFLIKVPNITFSDLKIESRDVRLSLRYFMLRVWFLLFSQASFFLVFKKDQQFNLGYPYKGFGAKNEIQNNLPKNER